VRAVVIETLAPGAVVLRGFAGGDLPALESAIGVIEAASPFRHLVTPGGRTMSVAMTNCGTRGWVSDRRGYRYERTDPLTGRCWPAMPAAFAALAHEAAFGADHPGFAPDCCLINRYVPGSALSLHRDHDEADLVSPIVSVSLGAPATFLWGGLRRTDPVRRVRLEPGDVVVWGGGQRLTYHGVARLAGVAERLNITFRATGLGPAA
jgi:alkylated DNA repair protein (DNA oxidative demethylase)